MLPQAMLDLYFQQLPQYLGLPLSQLKFKRVLFAGLPCYENGPLQPQFDRIIQVSPPPSSFFQRPLLVIEEE